MRRATIAVSILMFSAPLLLLCTVYDALPAELTVLRSPMGGTALAAKSAFTVFRVPLMNATHGAMAAVMLSRARDFRDGERRASYSAFFSTLIFAIALKSDFEAMEISGPALSLGTLQPLMTAGTILSVVGGLTLAFVRGRDVRMPWTELRLSLLDKVALTALFLFYVSLVTGTLLVSHRA